MACACSPSGVLPLFTSAKLVGIVGLRSPRSRIASGTKSTLSGIVSRELPPQNSSRCQPKSDRRSVEKGRCRVLDYRNACGYPLLRTVKVATDRMQGPEDKTEGSSPAGIPDRPPEDPSSDDPGGSDDRCMWRAMFWSGVLGFGFWAVLIAACVYLGRAPNPPSGLTVSDGRCALTLAPRPPAECP
jgi:hypothetical protein